MKKILWVCSDLPFPPTHGGRVDMWERIKIASNLGYIIDLVITIKDDENISSIIYDYVRTVTLVKRSCFFLDFLSFKPFQVTSRNNLRKITSIKNDYDLLFLESEYVYEILNNKNISYNNVALRIHNNESKYFSGLAKSSSNIVYKLYYYLDSFKFKFFCPLVHSKVESLLFISNSELENSINKNKSKYHPTPAVQKSSYTFKKDLNILFIGSFFMQNNQEAIQWYISNIHPKLLAIPSYKLILVGNSKGVESTYFDKIMENPRIEIFKSPADLSLFYQSAMLFINPMLNGAGVKIKTINAIENGLPVVSTSIGVEGIGLIKDKDFLLADSAVDFENAIINLYKNEELRKTLAENAMNKVVNNHVIIEQLKDLFKN